MKTFLAAALLAVAVLALAQSDGTPPALDAGDIRASPHSAGLWMRDGYYQAAGRCNSPGHDGRSYSHRVGTQRQQRGDRRTPVA